MKQSHKTLLLWVVLILTMLVMVFLVEAVERARRAVGIWTILGYALAALLTFA